MENMTLNMASITIADIKKKLNKKYFRTECYLLAEFIDKYNISNIDDIKFVKTENMFFDKNKKAQMIKTKNTGTTRIHTFAII